MTYSTDTWTGIDGHVILLVFLPGLLFLDSYNIDVHLFTQSFSQLCELGASVLQYLRAMISRIPAMDSRFCLSDGSGGHCPYRASRVLHLPLRVVVRPLHDIWLDSGGD